MNYAPLHNSLFQQIQEISEKKSTGALNILSAVYTSWRLHTRKIKQIAPTVFFFFLPCGCLELDFFLYLIRFTYFSGQLFFVLAQKLFLLSLVYNLFSYNKNVFSSPSGINYMTKYADSSLSWLVQVWLPFFSFL